MRREANKEMTGLLMVKAYPFTLSQCILEDSFTVMCWTGPFVILGMLGLFCHFYSIFDGNYVDPDQTSYYVMSDLGLHCLPMNLFTGFLGCSGGAMVLDKLPVHGSY